MDRPPSSTAILWELFTARCKEAATVYRHSKSSDTTFLTCACFVIHWRVRGYTRLALLGAIFIPPSPSLSLSTASFPLPILCFFSVFLIPVGTSYQSSIRRYRKMCLGPSSFSPSFPDWLGWNDRCKPCIVHSTQTVHYSQLGERVCVWHIVDRIIITRGCYTAVLLTLDQW